MLLNVLLTGIELVDSREEICMNKEEILKGFEYSKQQIAYEVSPISFNTFVKGIKVIDINENENKIVLLLNDDDITLEYVKKKYLPIIKEKFCKCIGVEYQIELRNR